MLYFCNNISRLTSRWKSVCLCISGSYSELVRVVASDKRAVSGVLGRLLFVVRAAAEWSSSRTGQPRRNLHGRRVVTASQLGGSGSFEATKITGRILYHSTADDPTKPSSWWQRRRDTLNRPLTEKTEFQTILFQILTILLQVRPSSGTDVIHTCRSYALPALTITVAI